MCSCSAIARISASVSPLNPIMSCKLIMMSLCRSALAEWMAPTRSWRAASGRLLTTSGLCSPPRHPARCLLRRCATGLHGDPCLRLALRLSRRSRMLDVNSLNAALRCFLLRSRHSLLEAHRRGKHDLVANAARSVFVPDMGDRAFGLVIDVPGVDNERGERWCKDVEVTDFDRRPRHQCWHRIYPA